LLTAPQNLKKCAADWTKFSTEKLALLITDHLSIRPGSVNWHQLLLLTTAYLSVYFFSFCGWLLISLNFSKVNKSKQNHPDVFISNGLSTDV